MKDSIKRKIKKLLRLARNNGNANERERALEAANDLLAKHNLEMAEISIDEEEYSIEHGKRFDAWHNNIVIALEMLFFVKGILSTFLTNGRKVKKLGFAGKPDNIAAAFEIFAYLTASIRSEAKRYSTNRDAFLNGAADGVYLKAKQIIAKEESLKRSNSDCTALAVLRDSEQEKIKEYLESNYGVDGVHEPRKKKLDFDAYQAGVRHGLLMSLKAPATKRVEVKSMKIKFERGFVIEAVASKTEREKYRVIVSGPGYPRTCFYVVCFNPYRAGWYYYATSSNPSESKPNSLRALAPEAETLAAAIELTKKNILEMLREMDRDLSLELIKNLQSLEQELAGFDFDKLALEAKRGENGQ